MGIRILLDMDEVLADFVGGACREWGVLKEHLYAVEWPTFSIEGALSKLLSRKLTMEQFWEPINGNPMFWHQLEPLPWAFRLVEHVRSLTDDWYVVTSPSQCQNCISGKKWWLSTHLPGDVGRMVPTHHKHLFAKPNVVLVDDRESTVLRFREEGGQAILWPHPGNSARKHVDSAYERVTHLLTEYAKHS